LFGFPDKCKHIPLGIDYGHLRLQIIGVFHVRTFKNVFLYKKPTDANL